MATHVSNFKQTDEKILLDLINHDNATTMSAASVIFGEATSAGDVGNELATNITLTAATGSGYRGTQTFTYNRVPLSFMDTLDPTLVLVTDELTTHDLLDHLNEHFGVQMTAADIVLDDLPVFLPDVNTDFVLEAAVDSKIFFGTVTLTGTAPTIPLDEVLTVTALDGLYPPTALPSAGG